jgi:hypothetical protein
MKRICNALPLVCMAVATIITFSLIPSAVRANPPNVGVGVGTQRDGGSGLDLGPPLIFIPDGGTFVLSGWTPMPTTLPTQLAAAEGALSTKDIPGAIALFCCILAYLVKYFADEESLMHKPWAYVVVPLVIGALNAGGQAIWLNGLKVLPIAFAIGGTLLAMLPNKKSAA